ncbi:MAG: TetR/AcrR family transcriptional regulator [Myxococcus sp.]|nr:TetR/AcrR family transcriptional regulator [Myxococcus sp.]
MRDRQREETRRRLYLAALEVFRRDGVQGCRIDDIAQKAEVSRAAFYFHFPTKEHVLLDFLAEGEVPQARALTELPATASLEALLTTCIDEMAAVWSKEPTLLVDAMIVSIRHTAVLADRDAGGPVRHLMAQRFKELAARNELSTVLTPEVLSDFFLSNCFVALMAWANAPQTSLDATLKSTMQLFLQGARPPKK